MTESQYIQEVRRLIGTFKNADVRYKQEEDNARKFFENECKAANAEIQTICKESEMCLSAAQKILRHASFHEIKIQGESIVNSYQFSPAANVDPNIKLKKYVTDATEVEKSINLKLNELVTSRTNRGCLVIGLIILIFLILLYATTNRFHDIQESLRYLSY